MNRLINYSCAVFFLSLIVVYFIYELSSAIAYEDFKSFIFLILGSILFFKLSYVNYEKFLVVINDARYIVISFFVIYYSMGILPFSTYRDYVSLWFWTFVALTFLASMVVGMKLGRIIANFGGAVHKNTYVLRGFTILHFIILISFCAAAMITVEHGLVFFNPEARFGVSAKLAYLVEFSIASILTLYCYSTSTQKRKVELLSFAVFVMLLSLGYRNQPILLVIGMVLIKVQSASYLELIKFRKVFSYIFSAGIFLFGLSYLIRINNSVGRTLNWKETILEFDILWPSFSLPFIPLHMAAREGIGVAELALERIDDVETYVSRVGFFFLDFLTMLPGYELTSGRVLGYVVNLNDTSSLTPSVIGGVFLAFGWAGIILLPVVMMSIISYAYYKYKMTLDPHYKALTVLFAVYTIELINRGIFKPMYIFSVLIIYLVLLFRRRL